MESRTAAAHTSRDAVGATSTTGILVGQGKITHTRTHTQKQIATAIYSNLVLVYVSTKRTLAFEKKDLSKNRGSM